MWMVCDFMDVKAKLFIATDVLILTSQLYVCK